MPAVYSIGRSVYTGAPRFAVCADDTTVVVLNADGSTNDDMTARALRLAGSPKSAASSAEERVGRFTVNMSSIAFGALVAAASLDDAQARAVDTIAR